MNTTNVHLVIVTGQAQANLIPILQLKPDVIILAVSHDMEKKASEFAELLTRAVLKKTEIKLVNHVPDVGIAAIEEKASEIDAYLKTEYPQSIITYHATGGTKLMALGFYTVFANGNNAVIYTDTAHSQIEFVYPRNRPAIPSQHVLNMKTYLRSLGFSFLSSSSDDPLWKDKAQNKKRQELTQSLAENAPSLDVFLGKMNGLADHAMNSRKTSVVTPFQILDISLTEKYKEVLEKLNEKKLCQWNKAAPKKITFQSVNGAKYINGLWLEEYVWLMAEDLGISEVKSNVKFSRGQETPTNEMDCIAVHNNRLLAIECKTSALEKKDTKDSNNMLYKLEALGKGIGGLYHEEWLVSARPVPLEVEQRAKAANIKIIHPNSLKDLKTALANWRDAKRQ